METNFALAVFERAYFYTCGCGRAYFHSGVYAVIMESLSDVGFLECVGCRHVRHLFADGNTSGTRRRKKKRKERRLIVTRGFLFEVSLYEDTVFIPLDLLALADEQPANTISFSR